LRNIGEETPHSCRSLQQRFEEAPVSYTLEFYSLSWDTLRKALAERKRELVEAVIERQWDKLFENTDLRPNSLIGDDEDEDIASEHADSLFADGLDEIAEVMKHQVPVDHDAPDLSDNAALVFSAFVRHLGRPVGTLAHDGTAAHDQLLPLMFREMFLDGVAGSCFGDHKLGEKLAARTMFGLFHLDFLSWGGLTQQEMTELLPKYQLTAAQKQEEEWEAVAEHAEAWLDTLVKAMGAAAKAKGDLVTLSLTVQHHFSSFREGAGEEIAKDLFDNYRRAARPAGRPLPLRAGRAGNTPAAGSFGESLASEALDHVRKSECARLASRNRRYGNSCPRRPAISEIFTGLRR
jgi:predicted RNA-binding protein Jag